jgi:hypothetical protein
MRSHVAVIFRSLGAFALAVVAASTASQAATRTSDLAPVDRYFGRAGMSPLEIANRIRHGEDLARIDPAGARRNVGMLLLTQDAVESMARQYPRDPWVARDEHRLEPLFARMHTPQGAAGDRRCRTVLARIGSPMRVAVATRPRPSAASKHSKHRKHFGLF